MKNSVARNGMFRDINCDLRNKGGRPAKYTPELLAVARERVAATGLYLEALEEAGVHRTTAWRWRMRAEAGKEPFASFFAELERAQLEFMASMLRRR